MQSELEGAKDYEEMDHVDHVPQQWLPPYDGTSFRAGSLHSASCLSLSLSDSGSSTLGATSRGLGTVLSGAHRQPGNYRRAANPRPCQSPAATARRLFCRQKMCLASSLADHLQAFNFDGVARDIFCEWGHAGLRGMQGFIDM